MADINHARNTRGELANQYELLEAARIDPDSEEAAAYRAETPRCTTSVKRSS